MLLRPLSKGMSHDLRPDRARESAGDIGGARGVVWRVFPAERAVSRLTARLFGSGLVALAAGTPGFLAFLLRGSTVGLRTGLLAVGYACLALAAAVPALYWGAVLWVAVATLLVRRWLPVWRRLRCVHPERVVGPGGRLRF
jgi:hypothetical protein